MATATMESEDTAAMDECWTNLPTDAFVEILLRVPQGNRWRLRFVCRRWRDVIRERMPPAPDERPVALAFVVNSSEHRRVWASAYVVDDLAEGRCRELWRSEVIPPARRYNRIWRADEYVEGACNGLLCLCDDAKPGGAITLVSTVSRETVAVPPLPGSAQWLLTEIGGWHEAYSFAYDLATDRYMVVHVPCYLDRTGGFNVLQVFTLGDAAGWRDVNAI
ncbi:uncharacterized protein [Miscanthus floridulus]|uniref:uncharacterized protein n=1 Tax=Miscanthus floridulus TaxID=154761 RepID=UPI003457FC22